MGSLTAKTSGEIASFMSPSVTNIKSLKVHFSPKQLGTGDPSPENVREIVGWDGVEVNGSGKNLINLNTIKREYRVNIQGEVVRAATYCLTDYIPVFSSSKYYLSNAGTLAVNACTAFYDKNKELLNTTRNITPMITPSNCAYIRCSFRIENIDIVQLELGSTATSYEPYQGNNISYQWKLPDEYQEVEYIESTGTQYIELPFGFDRTDEIETRFTVLKGDASYISDKYIVSPSRWNDKSNRFAMGIHTAGDSGYNAYCIGFGGRSTNATFLQPTTLSDFLIHTWTYKDGVFNVSEIGLSLDVTGHSFGGTTYPLKLFYGYNSNTMGKIAYYKHKKINGDMYDLVPCYRKSDGEIGMYDTVSQTFYTNQGTGTFLKGEDVNKTFYGGYVDLISGELVEEYSYLDLSNLNWDATSQVGVFRSDDLTNYYVSSITNFICNKYITTSRASTSIANMQDLNIKAHDVNDKYIYIKDTGYTDVAEFKSSLIDCNMVYLLATPITHQLTPTQLKSFVGQNNFWSNADYVEIEYDLIETIDIQKAKQKIILNQPQLKTVSDKVVSFNTDMVAPVKNCKIYFKPIQLGSGDPSPTNVRDINGWTGVDSYVNGDKISVDWTSDVGTVYGGYLDLAKKEVVAEWECNQLTSAQLESYECGYSSNVSYFNTSAVWIRNWNYKKIGAIISGGMDGLCNMFPISIHNKNIYASQYRIYFKVPNTITSLEDFKTNIQNAENNNNGLFIAYKLATPIHYPLSSLTSQQLLTIKGWNNYWSNVDTNLEVKYWTHKIPVSESNIAYVGENLTFDGTVNSIIDTGIYLFNEENINRDFEVIIEGLYGNDKDSGGANTVICAKHNGNAYGFLVRINSNSNATYNGTIAVKINYNNTLVIKRVDGVISVNGDSITNPKVKFTNAVHQWSLVLGCAIDDNGTYYRFSKGSIKRIIVRWL